MKNSFNKYARSKGIPTTTIESYQKYHKPMAYNLTPMVLEERSMNTSAISVFDRLMQDRIIFLGEEIDDTIANIINAQLLFLSSEEEMDDPIWLYINSPGGSVSAGLSTYDLMSIIDPPHTLIIGEACSMAAVLALAGAKKHRYILKHSRMMLHQLSGGISYSQATDIDIYNKEMQSMKLDLLNVIVKHTGQDIDKVRQDCERDYWMNADTAIAYGAIDKIMTKLK